MEKIDQDFDFSDYHELDDLLDDSWFSREKEMEDVEEDESGVENKTGHYRSLSSLLNS